MINMKLLETIRMENGIFSNLIFHQERINRSIKDLFDGKNKLNLINLLNSSKNKPVDSKLYKCRIVYSEMNHVLEFASYEIPKVKTLTLVYDDEIEYSYKYLNRKYINELVARKGVADDIIIVKKGIVTDTSFSNLIFYDGNRWLTPASPLLAGTQRAMLLGKRKIHLSEIKSSDVVNFEKIRLINAMIRFEDELDVSLIE